MRRKDRRGCCVRQSASDRSAMRLRGMVALFALAASLISSLPATADTDAAWSMSSAENREPVIIVTDPKDHGDDTIAILMLLASARFDVRGIVTTAGNVCAKRGAENALQLMQGTSSTVPVVAGFPMTWHEARRRYYSDVERPSWTADRYV